MTRVFPINAFLSFSQLSVHNIEAMSYAELGERPAKKRRFFVDDVDEPALNPEPSLPDEINALPEIAAPNDVDVKDGNAPSFDAGTLEAFIGESLAPTAVEKLRDLSGNNLERCEHFEIWVLISC